MTPTLLALLACSDTELHRLEKEVGDAYPTISVTPERLDFGETGTGDPVALPFTVWSVGEATLRVESIVIEGATSFTLAQGGDGFDLLPGESRALEVVFDPMAPGDEAATVVIASDDDERPVVEVPLTGGGQVPYLQVTPDAWDFGTLPVGCADTLELTLQNVGTDDLDVTAWSYGGEGYSIVGAMEPPFTLAPYAWTSATVTFSPTVDGAVDGALSVESNDPRGVVVATQTGAGSLTGEQRDVFTSEADPPIDILFAVDQSASMDDDAAGLAAAFQTFIDTIAPVTTGWQVGVVTMDTGCFNGGVLTAATPDLIPTFTEAVAFGDDREILYDEALFQVVDAALGQTATGGCNAGFLRAGAPLHVIVVSDEPERSTEEAAAWTWDWYLARWNAYVASAELLRVSGIVDTDGCNEGAAGYEDIIGATGGDALSICTGDWAGRLSTLASLSVASAWTFALSGDPVPASITVEVDGAAWTDWRYDAGRNAVIADNLRAGQTVVIDYSLASGCP